MGERLPEKVALITDDPSISFIGAAGGIGSATAKLFAEHGARLTLFDRDESNLQLIAQECDKISVIKAKSFTFAGNITDEKTCREVVEETVNLFGKIDILVNCAGIVKGAKVDEFGLNAFDDVMAVNIRAVVVMSALVIPYLKQTEGNIVSIASVAGHRNLSGFMAYGVSKAAVIAYTRYASAELASFKIRVNCISPGFVETPLLRNPLLPEDTYEKRIEELSKRTPIGRIGQPEEIAQSVLYLASDLTSSFITGTDLVIDGGWCVKGH